MDGGPIGVDDIRLIIQDRANFHFHDVRFQAWWANSPSSTPAKPQGDPMTTITRPNTQPTDPRSNVGLTSGTP